MTCQVCGDICRCSSAVHNVASPRWLADDDTCATAAEQYSLPDPPVETESGVQLTAEVSSPVVSDDGHAESAPEDSLAWREEVAARLTRYQSRRKPRPPRYPSLRLRFEGEGGTGASSAALESDILPTISSSHQALALNEFNGSAVRDVDPSMPGRLQTEPKSETAEFAGAAEPPQPRASTSAAINAPTKGRILEFPRSWTPPPAPLDELAEPVMDRPRILEAPEVVPPPPALGGIAIDPLPPPAMEKRPGIDIPLQSAPLTRRILSAAVDDLIIAAACVLFGFIFWKMTAIRPPRFQTVGLAAGLLGTLWAAYQYLLVVYAGITPGLWAAGIKLARFDGSPAGRRLRRWRVLASFLSAVSLGMGYAWVFLDEDALCWHDRITRTYLAPNRREITVAPPASNR